MTMRFMWTAIALCTAVVISSSNAEAAKRSRYIPFEGCLYYRTTPPPPCFFVRDYALVGVKSGPISTILPVGVYVRGRGVPAGNISLCGRKPLRVLSLEEVGPRCIWPMP